MALHSTKLNLNGRKQWQPNSLKSRRSKRCRIKHFVVIFLERSKPARNIRIFSFPVSPVPPITDGALAPGRRGPRLRVDPPGSPKDILGLSPSYMVSGVFCKISLKINKNSSTESQELRVVKLNNFMSACFFFFLQQIKNVIDRR